MRCWRKTRRRGSRLRSTIDALRKIGYCNGEGGPSLEMESHATVNLNTCYHRWNLVEAFENALDKLAKEDMRAVDIETILRGEESYPFCHCIESVIVAGERDRRDNRTRYTKNHYKGKRKDVPVKRDDMDTYPEEPSFQKMRGNIKAFLHSSIKPQSVADRGRSISRERKSSNFERSPSMLCDLIKKDKVFSSEMHSKNSNPSNKFVVSASSEESSSSDRTMDEPVVIVTVTAENPSVSPGRDVGLHARDETGQFFNYPENVDVATKFLQYKKSLDEEWGDYVMNAGLCFRTLVRLSGRRGRISLLFKPGRIWVEYSPNVFQNGIMNALKSCPGQLNVCLLTYCELLTLFVAVLPEPNPKVVADTSILFDIISREGSELNKVLGELGIRREKRLNSVVKKVQQGHQKQAMVASGSAYADVMEIPSYAIDIRASSKDVNLEVEEQEALDLATRDPIRLDTQIRSSISQLSVTWKLVAEVLKLAAANHGKLVRQHDTEKAALQEQFEQEKVLHREQFEKEKVLRREQLGKEDATTKQEVEDEAKKVVDIAVTSQNKLIQAFYFWGLSKEDVDLALAGKYGKIVFPGDDASPVAEQSLASPVDDDPTKEEVVHLRGKVIEMEKALSRARDSINRTQQGQRAMRILFFNIKKKDRKIHAQLEIDLRHACDELERCKGHNACLETEKVEFARLLQNSDKRVTFLEACLLDTQQHLQVSQSHLKKKITPKRVKRAADTDHERQMADVIAFYGGELERVENEFRRYILSCGKDMKECIQGNEVFEELHTNYKESQRMMDAGEAEINYSREVDNKLHRLKQEMVYSVQITKQYRGSLLQEKKSLEARCKDLDDELNKVKTEFYEATFFTAENVMLRAMAMFHADVEKF
ncbi:hypothetical protein GIB67_039816 [Kingdonia uniflora]|uniref:Uncharacterized protein n=1 Tax=Kingdonia uniflora TaxID=39325 RepID=A0A7J7P357_9MAGN|nr:hypothetical protein GIB67_039816 [Kingdonia uniflora]